MRKIIIAGNWKMNKTALEAIELITALKREVNDIDKVDVVVCPTAIALADVEDLLQDSHIGLGAQNLHWEDSGAFTGEISASMIKSIGARYVIIGHSERRQFFGETNETVNKKIKAALKEDLKPIVCVGEVLEEREAGKTFDVIKEQCEGSLANLTNEEMGKIILAYEPVWAIGTGKTASPDQAQEVHQYIRELLTKLFSEELAQSVRIQYGGSVKQENTADLMSQPDIDGALVGGASLESDSFAGIIKASCTISK
ncbi:MAG: triose-phosphate isomerase [Candidatus Omnitrophica bacterium]|nr:triose-phosphate isomerase [Candidatus Omnitrophota bacterium]